MQNNKEVAVTAEFITKPDRIAEAVEILQGLIAPTKAEEGCLHYSLYQDPEQSSRLVFIERWASYESWQVHLKTDHVQNARNAIDGCLAQPVVVEWFQCVS